MDEGFPAGGGVYAGAEGENLQQVEEGDRGITHPESCLRKGAIVMNGRPLFLSGQNGFFDGMKGLNEMG